MLTIDTERFDPMAVPLEGLLRTMTGPRGIDIRDRYHQLRRYRACFSGSDLVDLFSDRFAISRHQAVRLGKRLVAHEKIRHVLNEHDLEDAAYFYVFGAPDQADDLSDMDLSRAAITDLARAMKKSADFVVSSNRRWLIDYPQTFSGTQVVDWIIRQTLLERQKASQVGRGMIAVNMIRHVLDERNFDDSNQLYRFV